MPNHSSAIKSIRQTERRRIRNVMLKTALKTAHKKVLSVTTSGNIEDAQEALRKAIKLTDKACSKGVIHPNKRSRKISKLTKRVNAMELPNTK